jgi:hypothetical protein
MLPATLSSSMRSRISSRADSPAHSWSVAIAGSRATTRRAGHGAVYPTCARPPVATNGPALTFIAGAGILIYKLAPGKRAAWLSIAALYASGSTALFLLWESLVEPLFDYPYVKGFLLALVVAGSIFGESGHASPCKAMILTFPSPPFVLPCPSCTHGRCRYES